MPSIGLLVRERVVSVGGRRYICRPPTVATYLLSSGTILDFILSSLRALRDAGVLDDAKVEDLLHPALTSPSTAELIATCCELDEAAPGELLDKLRQDFDLRVMIASECLSLCDVAEVARMAGISLDSSKSSATASDPEEDVVAHWLCDLAELYSCAPHDVLRWPVESALIATSYQAAKRMARDAAVGSGQRGAAIKSVERLDITRDSLAAAGIPGVAISTPASRIKG